LNRLEYPLDSDHEWSDLKLASEPIFAVVVPLNDGYEPEVVYWWYSENDYPRGAYGVSLDAGVTWEMVPVEEPFLFEEWGDRVGAHHHPTIPTAPNRGKVLSRMGSL